MTGQAVLCLAQLGDHLGLSKLFDDAVTALIQQPWVENMQLIAQILALLNFQHDNAKIDRLLHHSQRGAFTELQVFELLEMANVSENSMVAILHIHTMQSAELDTLLGILTNTEHAPGMLLYKAVQQHRLPESLQSGPDWSASVRILHSIMIPDAGTEQNIEVPHSKLRLKVDHIIKDGEHLQCFAEGVLCCYASACI